ncbi:MAG: hypothetical protein KatS3mg031_0156 [Chitinophagales bacterium]|nr:MAG: hypothetical protein KatS3mg031_0156 [Chitinophagales bacterium]
MRKICFPLILILLLCSCKKEDINNDRFIAYIGIADNNYGEVYICNRDGSDSRLISQVGAKNLSDADYSPEFSPDGSKVKFRGFDFMLRVYDLSSNSLINIEKAFASAWSSDSKKIAYVKTTDTERQLYITNADGTGQQQLTSYRYWEADTAIVFNGLAWHPDENVIITRAGVDKINNPGSYLVKIHPQSGKVVSMYPLNFSEKFTLHGNKITWADGDTVFIHDLISKNTTHFVATGESPKNPVFSPDGSRVAYTIDREYQNLENGQYVTRYCTDIVTRNLNGYDKRVLTVLEKIPDNTKAKSSFYPFWLSNSELLYSAGNIYKVTDDVSPSVSIIGNNLQAYGQLQANF